MAVELTPKLEERIRKQVESGEYASVDELLDQALDVLEYNRTSSVATIRKRFEELRSGAVQPIDGAQAIARLRQQLRRME